MRLRDEWLTEVRSEGWVAVVVVSTSLVVPGVPGIPDKGEPGLGINTPSPVF
jgi:hypothetical protein